MIPDVSPPSLLAFSLDLSNRSVSLTFSEYVNVDSFVYANFFILNSDNVGTAFGVSLINSAITLNQSNNSVVVIDFSPLDFLALQTMPSVGTARSNTYLSIGNSSLLDLAGNIYIAESPIQATDVFLDFNPPELISYALNLGLRRFILTFSEPVDPATATVSAITVYGMPSGAGGVTLMNSTVIDITPDGTVVSIALGTLDNLNLMGVATTSINDTFISFTRELIDDYAGLPVIPILAANRMQVAAIQDDTLPPSLLQFTLDLNTGVLRLDFSERIDLSTFNETDITLQSASTRAASSSVVNITGGTTSIVGTSQVFLELLDADLNQIKLAAGLANSVSDTFIVVPETVIADTSGTLLVPITEDQALMVAGLVQDTSPPTLDSFDIDLDSGTLRLRFSEFVRTAGFMVQNVELQESISFPSVIFNISGSTFSGDETDIVEIAFSTPDLETLKIEPLCTVATDCFLTINGAVVTDLFGIPNIARQRSNPASVANFTVDTTSPQITEVTNINLETGEITLQFSEPLDISTFNVSALMLHSIFIDVPNLQTVTFVNSTTDSSNGRELQVFISEEDLDAIKLEDQLCTSIANCYVRFSSELIRDVSGNPATAFEAGDFLLSMAFTGDMTAPNLTAFDFDLNNRLLVLEFDEPVDVGSFRETEVTLQSAFANPSAVITLATSSRSLANGRVINVTLSISDIQTVQDSDIARTRGETWLTHSSGMISDIAGNNVNARLSGINSLQVRVLFTDMIPPEFVEFVDFDINADAFALLFSEPMNISSIEPSNITFHSDSTGGNSYTLTGFRNVTSTNRNTQLTITLSEEDARQLRFDPLLVMDESSTYIMLDQGAFSDVAGNPVVATGREVTLSYSRDITSPILESFTLDINAGILMLSFDEIVSAATLDPTELTFFATNETITDPLDMYTLTGGLVTTNGDGEVLSFELSGSDLSILMSRIGLTQSRNSTYISVTRGFISDLSGVAVVAADRLQASNFTDDTTPPFLRSFSFDITTGTLNLEFSEYVIVDSLDITQITLLNTNGSNATMITLSGGILLPSVGFQEISLELFDSDLDFIKDDQSFGTSVDNLFISLTSATITDGFGRELIPIPLDNPQQAALHTGDIQPPIILEFSLDLNTGTLVITFDEVVNVTSLDVAQVRLVGDMGSQYDLTFGDVSAISLPVIQIVLSPEDLNNIKANFDLAVSQATTSLLPRPNLVADTSNNLLQGSPTLIQASMYTNDTNQPSLVTFNLDLDSDTLLLTFNETVDVGTIDVAEIYLQPLGNTTTQVSLDGSTVNSAPGPIIEIAIGFDAITEIKRGRTLAISRITTQISFSSAALNDTASNPVIPISNESGRRVTIFTPDTTSPSLVSYALDLNSDTLTLTFTETVDILTVNFTSIVLRSSELPSAIEYTLTGGTIEPFIDDPVVTIQFSFDDINAIKSMRDLAASPVNTFLTLANETILDMAGNLLNGVEAFETSDVFGDITPPVLLSFELIMTNGTEPLEILLRFSETVDVNSLIETSVTLLLTNVSNTSTDYTLTGGTSSAVDSPNVTIFVSEADLTAVRALAPLAQFIETSYLSFAGDGVRDIAGNLIGSQGPIPVSLYLVDLIPPFVQQFSLDMNRGRLQIAFSETVQYTSFEVIAITLQALQAMGPSFQLSPASQLLTTSDGLNMVVGIDNSDLNLIKELPELAVDVNTTFLVLSSFVRDIADNIVEEIRSTMALQATSYTSDGTSPRLVGFDLDMMDGILTLSFDETVNASSINPPAIAITTEDGVLSYSLTGGTSLSLFSDVIVVDLTIDDHNGLKAVDGLATCVNDTYIALSSAAIVDMNANPNDPISGVRVTNFVKDQGDPVLDAFDIDMDEGILVLSFDETVNISSLLISDLLLESGNGAMYNLNTSSVSQPPLPVVTVQISVQDLNELKRQRICLENVSCFLSFPSTLISDQVGRDVVPVLDEVVTGHVRDTTSPELVDFTEFDLLMRRITLEFSETINASSFDSTQLTLQSFFVNEPPTTTYVITSALTLTSDGTTVALALSESDTFGIKDTPRLCNIRANCYIVITNITVLDTSGNSNDPILQEFPGIVVTRFIDDTTSPTLDAFDLDMDEGLLTLSFSEPVEAQEIDASGITLLSMPNASIFEQLTLSGGSTTNTSGEVVVLELSIDDLNTIKSTSFIKAQDNTYLSAVASTITDVSFNRNPLVPINMSVPLPVLSYTPDRTPPQLLSFQLDLSIDQLVFTFDEPVQTDLVNFTGLILQNASTVPMFSRRLLGGTVLSVEPASTVIFTRLDPEDINVLKLTENFGTTSADTVISVDANAFTDNAGVGILAVDNRTATELVRDTQRVELIDFSIDMQTGRLDLTFNDIVLASTLDASAIAIQDDQVSTAASTVELTTLSTTTSVDGYVISVDIDPLDLLMVKSVPGLAVDVNSTWLTLQAFAIDDAFGVDVLAITNGNAIQVGQFTADTLPPLVVGFVFDLDSGELNITFTDTVDHTLLNVSLLTLFSDAIPTFSLQLDGGEVDRSLDGLTVIVTLTEEDLNELKNNTAFATSTVDTYLTIGPNAIPDLAGNQLAEVPISALLQAMELLPDTTGPQLRSFDLDLNAGEIRVTFSEPVDVTTVVSSGYTLQSKLDTTFFRDEQYTLLTGVSSPPNGIVIAISFNEDDLNGIFAITTLGNNVNDTYLIISSDAVSDISGNPAIPVPFTQAVQASQVLPDVNAPQLLSYVVDMNMGLLALSFSEVVLTGSVQFDQLSLHSTPNASEATTESFSLTGGTTQDMESNYLNITFLDEDFFTLQSNLQLATRAENTFLSLTNSSLTDAQDFAVIPIDSEDARPVTVYIADTTPPQLVAFDFDLNGGNLTLTFNEVVNRSRLVFSQIILRSDANSSAEMFPLTGSTGSSDLDTVMMVDIGIDNLNAIKALTNLATSPMNTFLTLEINLVPDTAENFYSDDITVFPVNTFTADTTNPELVNFDLDLNSELLTLFFSETVNVESSLDVRLITIQSTNTSAVDSVTLTTSFSSSENSPIVTIQLSDTDLNNIKSRSMLAADNSSTFISILSQAIQDMAGRDVNSIFAPDAQQVRLFTPDTRGPEITNYEFDLDAGIFTLSFNEFVNVTSIDLAEITFRSSRDMLTAETYTLTNTATLLSFTGTEIVLQLSESDLNNIKQSRNLATSNDTIFLQATANAVLDMSMNPLMALTAAMAEPVFAFTPDTNRPAMVTFDIDVNTQTLTIHFNETIDASSVNLTLITLQQDPLGAGLSLDLSGGTISGDTADFTIQLDQSDLNELTRLGICTTASNCHIAFPTEAFTDTAGNAVIPVNDTSAQLVDLFIVDNTPPELFSFASFDLNEGLLTLEFTETVRFSTVDVTQLSLDQFFNTESNRYTLSGGMVLGSDREVVTIQLTMDDLNGIKETGGVCFNIFQCWIRFPPEFLQDITGNSIAEVSSQEISTPLVAFIEDSTSPMLANFTLDLNAGNIMLLFDEPIRHTILSFSELTLASSIDGNVTYTLTGGTSLTSTDSTSFLFRLSASDLSAIKANTDLATSINNTFLNFTSALVSDVSISPIATGNPINTSSLLDGLLQASEYTRDEVLPNLVSFLSLDMNEGLLSLQFSEAVEINTFVHSRFLLQNEAASTPSSPYPFTGGSVRYLDGFKTVVELSFNAEDLLQIKLMSMLAISQGSSFISIDPGAIQDTSGNNVTAIISSAALPVVVYIPDTDSPQLISYTLDLNSGLLDLTFNDVVNNQLVDPTQITFNGVANGSDVLNRYQLTGGTPVNNTNGYDTTLRLINRDLNELKRRTGLTTSENDTFISLRAEFIRDVAGQSVEAIITSNGLQAADFTPDTTPPTLDQFFFNVNDGTITLSFSETVNISSLNATAITLQNSQTAAIGSTSFTLTGGTLSVDTNEVEFDLILTDGDLNTIKTITNLGASRLNTFLAITGGAVLDMNENELEEIPFTDSLQALDHTPDSTPPQLLNFTLDMNLGRIILTISESVSSDNVRPVEIIIQNAPSIGTAEDFQSLLNGGTVLFAESTIQTIEITPEDLNAIKAKPSLAVSIDSTFISLTTSAVIDFNGNNIEQVGPNIGRQAMNFIQDTTAPELQSFELLIGADELVLTFDETVNAGTIVPSLFSLQSTRNLTSSVFVSYQLTGARQISSVNSSVVTIDLLIDDLNAIRRFPDFVTTVDNTFIAYNASAVEDMNGNQILALDLSAAIMASLVTSDSTSPRVESFNFDLSSDQLTLIFSETVSRSSFDVTQITIQNSSSLTASFYQLTGGFVPSGSNHIVTVTLSRDDANEIKRITSLATAAESTFISYTSRLAADLNNNNVEERANTSALPVNLYIPDTTSPELESFDLLLDAASTPPLLLVLSFTETVQAETLIERNIVFRLSRNTTDPTEVYSLMQATSSLEDSATITVTVGLDDYRAIQERAPLGRTENTTFLSISDASVRDIAGNPLTAVRVDAPLQVSQLTADLVPPVLVDFSLDLDRGELGLTWDEAVIPNVSFSGISILSDLMNTTSFTLTGGQVLVVSATTIQVIISNDDLNAIFANFELATSASNTFINLDQSVLMDIYLNPNDPQGPLPANDADYRQDNMRPILVDFDFNLELGQIMFEFSETVNSSRLLPTELTFQVGESDTSVSYTLTGGTVIPSITPSVLFNLTIEDLNNIKSFPELAVSNETTFISFTADLIVDMADNRLVSVSTNNALPVRELIEDTTRPTLMFFNFDLDEGTLTLSFDETVNISSLEIASLNLQDAFTLPSVVYPLTDSFVMQSPSSEVVVFIGTDDLNNIKDIRNLCSDDTANDCFLSFSETTVVDMSGFMVNTVAGEQVTLFTNDSTSPELISFIEINLQSGQLILEFSETVDFGSFSPEDVTLQNLFEPPHDQFNLTGGDPSLLSLTSIAVNLTMEDLASLKRATTICSFRGNCYITAPTSLLVDVAGNSFAGIPLVQPGVIVQRFISDSVGPVLVSYNLDLDSNQLMLVFDEPVDFESLDVSGFTLQAAEMVSLASDQYTLTDGIVFSIDAVTLMVNLSVADANAIKAATFATSSNDTYITVAANSVVDLAATPVPNDAVTLGIRVLNYSADFTPPEITRFNLDLQLDQITLVFNEPIRTSTFNFTGIIVKSNCSGGIAYTLTGGTFVPANLADGVTRVTISLNSFDLIAIKSEVMLATETNNTFLEVAMGTVEDVSNNALLPVACLATVVLTADTVRPQLLAFDIDMHLGILNLTFDDVVDSLTWNPTAVVIQSEETAIAGLTYTLTAGSTTESPNGYLITVDISDADFLRIKSIIGLANTANTTFITMRALAIDDTLGVDVLAITDGKALQVQNYTPDDVSPSLVSYALDLDEGTLDFTFDDFTNVSTFIFDQFVLQGDANNPTSTLPLSIAEIEVSTDGFVLRIILNTTDLNDIKDNRDLASNAANTFLSIQAGSVLDLAENPVIEISLFSAAAVSNYTADTTGPELVQYSLDLNSSQLVLTFSETIDAATFNVSDIILQNSSNVSEVEINRVYRLTGGVASNLNLLTISVMLSDSDIDGLQTQPTIGSSAQTTFISIGSTLIMDTSSNNAMVIPQNDALQILEENFVADVTNPRLVQYDLDLNTGIITLTFTKLIQVDTIEYSAITLQNVTTAALLDGSYTLTGGTPPIMSTDVVAIELSFNDLNAIKTLTTLAVSSATTQLSFSEIAFQDTRGLPVIAFNASSPLEVNNLVRDIINPMLETWELDLDSGFITLNFTEAVQPNSLDITRVTIASNATQELALTLRLVPPVIVGENNDATLQVQLTTTEINLLKSMLSLAVSENSSFLVLAAGAVTDYANRGLTASGPVMTSGYTPDTSGPELIDFSLETSAMSIQLTFDEAVDIDSYVVSDTAIRSLINGSVYVLQDSVAGRLSAVLLNIVDIMLGPTDARNLIMFANMDSALTVHNVTVYDYAGNLVQPIGDVTGGGGGIDLAPPQVILIGFNANTGTFSITFTEPIDIATFNISGITLKSSLGVASSQFQFTSGLQTVTNSSVVVIQLSEDDFNIIKSMPNLARDTPTTVLEFEAGAVLDVSGNSLLANEISAQIYTPDRTPPQLASWDFDLNFANITLRFNEPVTTSTLNLASTITIRNNASVPTAITLSGGTAITTDLESQAVQFQLEVDDINFIYFQENLCTDTANCFITITSTLVEDIFGNANAAVGDGSAQMVTDLTEDISSPSLDTFVQLDFTNSTLILSFSETVNSSSLNATGLSLHGSFLAGSVSYTLTGGSTSSPNGPTIVIDLTEEDLNELKARQPSGLCSSFQTCYARVNPILVEDMSMNPVQVLGSFVSATFEGALAPTGLIADVIRPNLLSFDLDLTNDILSLTFDETVDYLSFRSEFISFQGQPTSNERITLDPVLTRLITTSYETTIDFQLSVDDVFNLKSDNTIATGPNDTFIVFTRDMITDIAGLQVVEVTNGINALPVMDFIPDTIAPQAVQVTQLDMNRGILSIRFNEPILPLDTNFTGITLQSSAMGGGSVVTLTNGTVTSANPQSTILNIALSDGDLRDIKLFNDLGRATLNSFVSISPNAFSDPAGNAIVEVNSSSALQASFYLPDVTGPMLTGFDFDLDQGLLLLTFDDAINEMVFDPTQITLHSAEDGTLPTTTSFQLTGYLTEPTTADSYVLSVMLATMDLNLIKAETELFTMEGNSFISADGLAIRDLFSNFLQSVVAGEAIPVTNFTADTTSPQLSAYTLDLDIGGLVLSFDETVNITTFMPSDLTLQNVQNASEPGAVTLGLSAAGVSVPNNTGTVFTYFLNNEDVNFIKERLDFFGSNTNNTFLSLSSTAIQDMMRNQIVAISTETAQPAVAQNPDVSPPELLSFSFDLNSGILELSFSESISGNSTMPVSFTLLESPLPMAQQHRLTGGAASSEDSPTLTIQLTESDLNAVKALTSLATGTENTYISFFSNAVTDLSNRGIQQLPASLAINASSFTEDTTIPVLNDYILDLNDGTLILTFSETVNASSLDVSGIIFQSVMNGQQRALAEPQQLSTIGVLVTPDFGAVLNVQLAFSDFTSLQLSENLATTESNTFLTIDEGSVIDTSGNPISPIFLNNALQAVMVISDTQPPVLLNYTFDLNSGSLLLTFSEVVVTQTIRATQFTIQSQSVLVQPYITLRAGTVNSSDGTVIQLILDNNDLNLIKEDLNFGTSIETTYLSVLTASLQDTSGNNISAIEQNSAQQASSFIPDTTPPRLLGFDLSTVGTGLEMVLYFSETVNGSSLNASTLTLHSTQDNMGISYTLQTAAGVPGLSDAITVQIDVLDAEEILLLPPIGQVPSTTFLTLPFGAITDVSGIAIEDIPNTGGVMALNISADFVPPRLESFSLDLTAGENGVLQLTFSEPINVTSINLVALTLQNAAANATASVTLSDGTIAPLGMVRVIVTYLSDKCMHDRYA